MDAWAGNKRAPEEWKEAWPGAPWRKDCGRGWPESPIATSRSRHKTQRTHVVLGESRDKDSRHWVQVAGVPKRGWVQIPQRIQLESSSPRSRWGKEGTPFVITFL